MMIKNLLVPSKANKFHPYLLRPGGLLVCLVYLIAIPLAYNLQAAHHFQVLGYATNINAHDLYSLTNQQRAKYKEAPLTLNATLNAAATAKARDMFAHDYWAHTSPAGRTPWSFITAAGYRYSVAGENLAKDFNTSAGAVAGWMGSSTHRQNILNAAYKDVGFAVMNGRLLGASTTLVVAMYGAHYTAPRPPALAAHTTPRVSHQNQQPAAAVPAVKKTAPKTVSPQTHLLSATSQELPEAEVSYATRSLPNTYRSLNWGQKASLFLLSSLVLINIMQHTVIWRQRKKGLHHIWLRAHPLAQAGLLLFAMVATLGSSLGVVK